VAAGGMASERVATGIRGLDDLLGGGLEPDGLTELYGEGGSAKTIVALQVAVRVALAGRWVFYIDTEGLSVSRLEAIAQGRLSEVLQRLLISTPKNLEEQSRAVHAACALAASESRSVGLLVLDSATFYYRLSLSSDAEDEGRQALVGELAELLATAIHREIPVLFTNQVWRSQSTGHLEPLGGSLVDHVAKTIVRCERLPGARRRLVLVKHRSLPEASAEIRITPTGVE
jgi:DNA repair protein RadB